MKAERTISILGKEVKMRYCAAAETGYEQLSGHSSARFIPQKKDGEVVPAEATTIDFIYLAVASIVAAYAASQEESPITAEQILYEASPFEVGELIKAVSELRSKWYNVPAVMNKKEAEEDEPKNA